MAVSPQIRKRTSPAPLDTALGRGPLDAVANAELRNYKAVELLVEYLPKSAFKHSAKELRKHKPKQKARLRGSIKQFGPNTPIVIGTDGEIIDGHLVFEVMDELGYHDFPAIRLHHLSLDQRRLYRIAVNKISEMTSWNDVVLNSELADLESSMLSLEIDPEILGFDLADFEMRLELASEATEEEDEDYETDPVAVSKLGDCWLAGSHRLLCGDSLLAESYLRLMLGEKARVVFADAPYNVPITGHVSGLGKAKHREFKMASGEMSREAFANFLLTYLKRAEEVMVDGGIGFHCMDFRSISTLIGAGEEVYGPLKQLIVWNKDNAGMGTFYRSQHELIAVFKKGTEPHVNNFGLGDTGRYRTNVWDYAGANTFRKDRDADLADHPTVKPIAMVIDAIKDVSKLGEIVLDPFGGSGTTMLAAERTHRRARLIELDPLYVDVAIKRWEKLTGQVAILEGDGRSFADVKASRLSEVTK